jgi:hypothetical protein
MYHGTVSRLLSFESSGVSDALAVMTNLLGYSGILSVHIPSSHLHSSADSSWMLFICQECHESLSHAV